MSYNLFHHTLSYRMISDSFLATPETMQIQSVTAATEQPDYIMHWYELLIKCTYIYSI